MKCSFCQNEFDDNLTECPYCHRQVEIEPKSLSPVERDNFDGVTLEMDGTISDEATGESERVRVEYQEDFRDGREEDPFRRETGERYETGRNPFGFKVYHAGGSSIWWTLLILVVILALVFFLLPAFLIIAGIGALVVFILRLFSRF